ncbi:hypothetical protein GEMRC1_011579 [Eukaryota sp. GEM-RC1]
MKQHWLLLLFLLTLYLVLSFFHLLLLMLFPRFACFVLLLFVVSTSLGDPFWSVILVSLKILVDHLSVFLRLSLLLIILPLPFLFVLLHLRFESLALRSQYSSALGVLEESSPAAFNDATLSALEKLLPHEDFVINYCVSSAEVDYYTTNPITASEILGCIRSLPSGRAAGPSGLSYDHLKAVINICSEVPRRLL